MKSSKGYYRIFSAICMLALVLIAAAGCKRDLRVYETFTGEDGTQWEQVSRPGFGSKNNGSIVALCEFQGQIYAVTRNDVNGFELWRTSGYGDWDKLRVPGFTNSDMHDRMNNVWSDLIVFQDKLYVTVSSGYQGSKLYKSLGFEIWRFDGKDWEPVVSQATAPKVEGRISDIASCAAADGSATADFTDSEASWTADEFKGGLLWIMSGDGKGRVFDIVGNTADTVTVQENESAGVDEDTICTAQEFTADAPFPKYTIGEITTRDQYKIIKGVNVNGFGELWNKSIVDLEIHEGELYASVGFNYEKGARVWKSADGQTWVPSSEYSMGSYHGFDADGNEACPFPGGNERRGQPVSSSLPRFGKLVSGDNETLVIGGTGTQGCNGRGMRLFRLNGDQWETIADYYVDDNDNGTNENGIGNDGGSQGFFYSNFQAWTWAMHDGNLFAGIGRLVGGRIMYTPNADPEDGNWFYAVGGDSSQPDGFGYQPNIAFSLFDLDNTTLIAGSIEEESMTTEFVTAEDRGADLWSATGPADSLTWSRITRDAFGDSTVIQFEAPMKTAAGKFYISASNFGPSTPYPTTPTYGAREGYKGAKVYRLKTAE